MAHGIIDGLSAGRRQADGSAAPPLHGLEVAEPLSSPSRLKDVFANRPHARPLAARQARLHPPGTNGRAIAFGSWVLF
jgi:hypothetical protein